MGARFAVTGGREGWIRTALTALGVGLGVAVLLLAPPSRTHERRHGPAAGPHRRTRRGRDRPLGPVAADRPVRQRLPRTPLNGRILAAEGPHAPVPPGLSRLPGPGELAVSPALADLLSSPEGALLKDRFPHLRITATIGDAGLPTPANSSSTEAATPCGGPATASNGSPRSVTAARRSGSVRSWCWSSS